MTPPTDRPSPVSQDAQTLPTLHREVATTDPPTAPTLVPAPGATLTPVEEARPALAGYDILEELGRGGMGVVYKARQQGLGRLVALKMILHADHATTEDRLRFLREAETLARLRHEHIVQVHEVGEHDGKPFICLEYVAGGGLDRRLAGTPLPPRVAAALVEKLADAMQIAHAHGIIHRDLKPANVLLSGEPAASAAGCAGEPAALAAGFGTPKITDFGLAKQQDAAGLSASGAVLGTPSYMAPEQAQGKGIDARADVYALGAILYECLTGRPPFRAATVMDTLLQVIADEPVPPCQFNPSVPHDLETICLKCLRKEAEQRYGSASGLAEDLGRFQRGEPVQARPVGRLERSWRWCKRNPMVASLLSLVLLLMTLGTGVAWVLAIQADEACQDANRKANEALRLKGEADEARLDANRKAKEADDARHAVDREAKEAVRQREFIEYVLRLREVQTDLDKGQPDAARDKLLQCHPQLQSWEYDYLLRQTQHLKRDILAHTNSVRSVAISPDGKRIVSASHDKTVKVWDAHTGQEVLTLMGHTQPLTSVAVTADGKRIVSGSEDATVKVWDARTGQDALTLKGHTDKVLSVAVTADSHRIISGSWDQTVKVWDATPLPERK